MSDLLWSERLLTRDEVLEVMIPHTLLSDDPIRREEHPDGCAVYAEWIDGYVAVFFENNARGVDSWAMKAAADLLIAAPSLHATALDLFAQLAAANARIVELERLVTGPRSSVDDGLARPFALGALHKPEAK